MKAIYEPKGKAREYAPLAVNLYKGCGHGCLYCYAPKVLFMKRENFKNAKARSGITQAMEKDAIKWSGTEKPVLLCFTCDPYQPIDLKEELTRYAIKILNKKDIAVHILTKGGMRAARDFDLMTKNKRNAFATTLTTDNDTESTRWEPGAARPEDRLEALRLAHANGIKTWVSFEPVIDPKAVFRLIETTAGFVDHYKVGKLNYHPHAKTIDWRRFYHDVTALLDARACYYYIKDDLRVIGQNANL